MSGMDVVWGGMLAALGLLVALWAGFEARGVLNRRPGDTFSEWIRPWARRHPRLFRTLCVVVPTGMGVVGAWLPGHILG
ncbi:MULTISPECIES: hypothetical protein [unclassified Streptomyces]|uniref:hypothetical protein n=1 Tax=unclassified Streptomyces TaxID=2593676 RepID=UPI001F049F01|nr:MULTISPECIES: hypothetical protein [unclassified Streptomyces]MCH0561969.1 hypothetical protein [Streptomyces sp. MUM 2J]MCH0567974.1 hypothetical protein [Streptomyces sp. MUM 136J]